MEIRLCEAYMQFLNISHMFFLLDNGANYHALCKSQFVSYNACGTLSSHRIELADKNKNTSQSVGKDTGNSMCPT